MTFWDRMKLWEKMLFVLGCAMVCTLLYAISKLMINNRRIRRHSLMAKAQKAHLDRVRSSRPIIQLKSDDVPFGIKALESGIHVEGIAVSRPATPTSTRSQHTLGVSSDVDSAKARLYSVPNPYGHGIYQPSPYLSLPSPPHLGLSAASSLRSSSVSVVSGSSRLHSSEAISNSGRRACSDPLMPDDPVALFPGSPSSPGSNLGFVPDSATLAQLEGRPRLSSPQYPSSRSQSRTPTPPDGQCTPTLTSVDGSRPEESARRSDFSDDSYDPPSRGPQLVAAYSTPRVPSRPFSYNYLPETAQGDLSLLHTHRLSHAAEVGQLLPRTSRQSRALSESNNFNMSLEKSPVSLSSPTTIDPPYTLDIAFPSPIGVLDTAGVELGQAEGAPSMEFRRAQIESLTRWPQDENWLGAKSPLETAAIQSADYQK